MSTTLQAPDVDPFLCLGLALLLVILLVINVYTFSYYSHPDDRNESYIARVIIIFGFQLSGMAVLMLPIGMYTLETTTEMHHLCSCFLHFIL